MPFKVF
ncbi:uncharacterized protein FFM5_15306 [Fusarium fujikuroi]|nr:uncharacterized protein FFM5_15306 [Fusarium fujikuroi]